MIKKIIESVVLFIGKIHWTAGPEISEADKATIRSLIAKNYFVVLTRRNNHLSTFFTGLASFIVNGKWSYWSHAVMNLEDEIETDSDFRMVQLTRKITPTPEDRVLMEATGEGTHISPFEKVFDVHAVALLKPKHMTLEQWTGVLDSAKKQLGKPYDTLFDIADDRALSCVELVRIILQGQDKYAENFANFERMITENRNLTPQMFYDCDDFSVVFEARV